MMPVYEIVNPSDQCTIEAEDGRAAAVATLLLGNGAYVNTRTDDEKDIEAPLLLFLGDDTEAALNEWCERELGCANIEAYLDDHAAVVADVLDSALYGDEHDRLAYANGLELIDDPAKRQQWRQRWEDDRRTSLNRICQRAWALAEALRKQREREGVRR